MCRAGGARAFAEHRDGEDGRKQDAADQGEGIGETHDRGLGADRRSHHRCVRERLACCWRKRGGNGGATPPKPPPKRGKFGKNRETCKNPRSLMVGYLRRFPGAGFGTLPLRRNSRTSLSRDDTAGSIRPSGLTISITGSSAIKPNRRPAILRPSRAMQCIHHANAYIGCAGALTSPSSPTIPATRMSQSHATDVRRPA